MCNLYSFTKGQQAIREITRAMIDKTGNLPLFPGIFPDYSAPIVRNSAEGRELTLARWGMPSPVFALKGRNSDPGVTNVRNTASPRGPFLDGYALRNADGDQWLSAERDRLRCLLMAVLDRLLERRMLAQDWHRSTQIAEMLLSHDPLREDAHRNLMRIYAQRGRRNLALRQYQLCREALAHELGVPPEPATEQLFQEIQSQEAPLRESPRDETGPAPVELSAEPSAPGSIEADEPVPSAAEAAPKERLVIAVLPFANIGNDPEQEYFADGLTEDIITDLSQISALCVVARHAVFAFKDSPGQVQRAARGLNANYVLKGSVRKAADRVRITAQLVDGATGSLVWGRRYDHRLDDIFSLQDEISKSIVDILCVKLLPAELETIEHRPTTSADAYQFYLLGRSFYLRGIDKRSLTFSATTSETRRPAP